MNIWLTTDTHFGHTILQEYCGRPEGVEETILGHLSQLVKPEDVLIHLGDICIGSDAEWHKRLYNEVSGKHWLLRGNHDSKSNSWYLSHGWDFVAEQMSMTLEGKLILFSHRPIAWDGYYDWNIHGHFHNSDHRRNEPDFAKIKNGYQRLLALEYTDYKPVLLSNFLKEPKND